jgi:bifunctional ADP-heptose synthase (sugar kinase/adenylyltransferase)
MNLEDAKYIKGNLETSLTSVLTVKATEFKINRSELNANKPETKVVLASGVFDLLHLGTWLEEARGQAENAKLIVVMPETAQ